MLKTIITIIQLRRTIESTVDFEDGCVQRVGENIMPYNVSTVELVYSRTQQRLYDTRAVDALQKLLHGRRVGEQQTSEPGEPGEAAQRLRK